jgi:hypothetical protein
VLVARTRLDAGAGTRAADRRVLELAAPRPNRSRELGLCERTVTFHVGSAMNNLGAENRTHAAVLATQLGLLAS